jgi:hypothetical protein
VSWHGVTQNAGWKLGSLTLAILLWLAILGEPELVTTHTAPVLYRNLPRELLIGSSALDQVRLEVRGPSGKLTPERLSEAAVVLNLADVSAPGERTFTLSNADIRLPQGTTFVRAIPSQLRVAFARLVSKDVPVTVKVSTQPPAGYRLVKAEAIPPTLRIAGPEGRMAFVNSAETDAIELGAVTQPSEIRVNAFLADPQIRFESPPAVTVKISIEKNK